MSPNQQPSVHRGQLVGPVDGLVHCQRAPLMDWNQPPPLVCMMNEPVPTAAQCVLLAQEEEIRGFSSRPEAPFEGALLGGSRWAALVGACGWRGPSRDAFANPPGPALRKHISVVVRPREAP